MTSLDDARTHLAGRAMAADGNEAYILAPLADVADMVCRIGDTEGSHYRAGKATEMVDAALRVLREVLITRAVDVGNVEADESVQALDADLRQVVDAVVPVMWATAEGRDVDRGQAAALTAAAKALTTLAGSVAFSAVPETDQ